MAGFLVLLLVVVLAWAFGSAAIDKRNELMALRAEVARTKSEFIAAELRKIDVINRMLPFALHHEAYEGRIIEQVTHGFAWDSTPSVLVTRLSAPYPILRAGEAYQELMRQVLAQEEAARVALSKHNLNVTSHNIAADKFPWTILLSSEPVELLDLSMGSGLLSAHWDKAQLKFVTKGTA